MDVRALIVTLSLLVGALPSMPLSAQDDEAGCPDRTAVVRRAGADRFGTAGAVSAGSFPSANVVYLASGERFPDALVAGPAAVLDRAPVLLTGRDTLPDASRMELMRLRPPTVVVLGGTAAIGDAVAAEAASAAGAQVVRLGGADRFATAALVSARTFSPGVPVAYVATGLDFPDALVGGAAAAYEGGPVLLATRDALPAATADELRRLQPVRVVALGGTSALAEAVVQELATVTGAPVTRLGGRDRHDTAGTVAAAVFPPGGAVFVATSGTFPDALAGTPAAGLERAALLLVTATTVPAATADQLARLQPERAVVLGGTAAVSDAVADQLRGAVVGSGVPGDGVVINEVSPRPTGGSGLGGMPWAELRNGTARDLDLGGWRVVNGNGDLLADLAGARLAAGGHVAIGFGDGPNDPDSSVFYAGASGHTLDHGSDGVGLYRGPQTCATLIDYVAWSPSGGAPVGPLAEHAVRAGIWPQGATIPLGFTTPSASPLLPGDTLGRDRQGRDTDSPDDWTTHGGADSILVTAGRPNTPLGAMPDDFLTLKRPGSLAVAGLLLQGYGVTGHSATNVQLDRSTTAVTASAEHTFTVTSPMLPDPDPDLGVSPISQFTAESTARWQRMPGGVVEEQVDVTVRPVLPAGADGFALTDSGAMSISLVRSMRRTATRAEVTQDLVVTELGSNQTYLDSQLALTREVVAADHVTTALAVELTPGPGLSASTSAVTLEETYLSDSLVDVTLDATIEAGSDTSTIAATYERRLFEDPTMYALLYGGFSPILEPHATYRQFDLDADGVVYSLDGEARTTVTKTSGPPGYQGTFTYDWRLPLVAPGGETLEFTLSGTETVAGNLISGALVDQDGEPLRYTVDPSPDPVGGIWIKGAIILGGVAAAVTVIAWATKDTTPPTVKFEAFYSSKACPREFGSLSVFVDGIDRGSGVNNASLTTTITNPNLTFEQTTSTSDKYQRVVVWLLTLRNFSTDPQTTVINASVQDQAGNTRTASSNSLTVPGAC